MRPMYFGDSYDIVKRYLLSTLAPLGPWKVHPMLTDEPNPGFSKRFAAFLETPLIGTEVFDHTSFLEECKAAGHLLLDPDTGVREGMPNDSRSRKHHVYISELVELARARPKALTAVFDQSFPRGSPVEHLHKKLGALSRGGLSAFAYRSHASFLFVSARAGVARRAQSLLLGTGLPKERFVSAART